MVQGKLYRTGQLALHSDPEARTEEEEESLRLPSTPSLFSCNTGKTKLLKLPGCSRAASAIAGSLRMDGAALPLTCPGPKEQARSIFLGSLLGRAGRANTRPALKGRLIVPVSLASQNDIRQPVKTG